MDAENYIGNPFVGILNGVDCATFAVVREFELARRERHIPGRERPDARATRNQEREADQRSGDRLALVSAEPMDLVRSFRRRWTERNHFRYIQRASRNLSKKPRGRLAGQVRATPWSVQEVVNQACNQPL